MRIVVQKTNVQVILNWEESARALSSPKGRTEMFRGVVDAGRKTKTQVQRVVTKQMALKSGNYTRYVVANTRGVPRKAQLAFDIFGVKGGAKIDLYKGLKSLVQTGKRAAALNAGRPDEDKGTVSSSVWNAPRVFKRSFATAGGWYAFRPKSAGGSTTAPKIFWTYGLKQGQPRDADGKFASTGKTYGKVRQLYGPSMMKEIPQGDSLAAFQVVAPKLLEVSITKRLEKLARF